MGFFDGINQTKAAEQGAPLHCGTYPELLTGEAKIVQGHHGTRFIHRLTVTAEGTPGEDASTGTITAPTPVGGTGDVSIRIDGDNRTKGLGNLKAYICKLLGVPPEEEMTANIQDILERAISAEQILSNRKISAVSYRFQTRAKHWMPGYRWTNLVKAWPLSGAVPPPVGVPALPGVPVVPGVPGVPPVPAPFPPPGWTAHPTSPGWYYKGQEVLQEAALRARGF